MKKVVLLFAFCVFVFHAVTARENGTIDSVIPPEKPLNEIKADLAPLLVPAFLSELMERTFAETAGFGLKAGYERMISDCYSAGAEFAFISSRVEAESFNAKISSIDAGMHGRFYPFGKFFYFQASFGVVSFNIYIDGSTGALDQFKENFNPYTGVGGSFDAGIGYRLLIGERFIIDTSIMSGLYLENTISAVTLPGLASGGIPALSERAFLFVLMPR